MPTATFPELKIPGTGQLYARFVTSMGNIVIPLFQLVPRGKNNTYSRSRALPDLPTFEEFYASVNGNKPLADNFTYEVLRAGGDPLLAMFRVALMPPKSPDDIVSEVSRHRARGFA